MFECPFCGKHFTRKANGPTLRKHKDSNGWDRSGRRGYLIDRRY